MAISRVKSVVQGKYFGLKRRVLARALPIGTYYYVLNEYPKSGGSWIGDMFADASELKYPHDGNNSLSRSLIHGHFMTPWGLDGSIVVWRDGRDVLTSSYYYYTREAAILEGHLPNHDLVAKTHKRIVGAEAADRQGRSNQIDFSTFLRMMLTSPVYPKLTWPEFASRWAPIEKCHHVRYEEFKNDPGGSLQKLVLSATGKRLSDSRAEEIVTRYSFATQSGREEGDHNANHFYRKGIVGDWKNHFSSADEIFFMDKARQAMKLLKYDCE